MDQSNEYADNPKAPETQAERIAAVSALIEGQDDTQPEKAADQEPGQALETENVRGDDGGSGEVDQPEPDGPGGVEDDPEADADRPAAEHGDDVTLSRLAEHLEMEPADLYELQVPIGDNVTATLGQLKDEFKEYGPAKEYHEALRRDRGDFEKQVLQTRSELNAVLQVIPEQMRAQIIQAAKERQTGWAQEQESKVLEAVPDWADADVKAKDRAMIVEDGAEYGFSEQEITYTQDARTLRWMRDFARMKRELQAMRTASKAQPGKANPPGKAAPSQISKGKLSQLLNKGRKEPTLQGKASVVSQLIRNQS